MELHSHNDTLTALTGANGEFRFSNIPQGSYSLSVHHNGKDFSDAQPVNFPGPGAAVLQGIIFGRTAPHRTQRRTFQAPALVIGHPRDPVHPFSDADMLAAELPNGRLIDANSIVELRLRPARLTAKIADFVDEVWSVGSARRPRRAARS